MWTKENRPKYSRDLGGCPGDLTGAEGASIAPVIPPGRHGGARRTVDVREIVNAIMHVPGAGCQWRAIPKDLPPRSAVYDCFDLRGWDGTRDRIRDRLCLACRDKAQSEASPTVVIIDSPAGGSPCARQSVKSAEIDYRKASGGRVIGHPQGEADLRNLVGSGLIDAKYTSTLHAYDAPSVDSAEHPVIDALARPEPQGFGPLAASWLGRRKHTGSFDASWVENRRPQLPVDFDYRFYQSAHPGIVLPGYLHPHASLKFSGMIAGGGELDFRLPDIEPFGHFRWTDGREVFTRLNCDGLHIDLRNEPPWAVEITYRGWLEICPRFLKVDAGFTDAAGVADLPVPGEFGLAEASS